jgi:hypothetical protein
LRCIFVALIYVVIFPFQELEVLRPGWHPALRVKPEDLFGLDGNEGSGGLPHFLSDNEGSDAEEALRLAALEHVRMGDPGRLPIEERKLMQLLTIWGCFKHVKGTSCQCRATGNIASRVVKNPDPTRRRRFVGASRHRSAQSLLVFLYFSTVVICSHKLTFAEPEIQRSCIGWTHYPNPCNHTHDT